MARKEPEAGGTTPFHDITLALVRCAPQLYSLVGRDPVDFLSLTLRQRGPSDFVCVLKRVGADGAPEVCFSNGFDFVSALLALEGTVAANRWRVDVPYDQRKP